MTGLVVLLFGWLVVVVVVLKAKMNLFVSFRRFNVIRVSEELISALWLMN